MIEILKEGLIESDEQIVEFATQFTQIIVPKEDLCEFLTHWWVIRENGVECLYVGTPETFATYQKEEEPWTEDSSS